MKIQKEKLAFFSLFARNVNIYIEITSFISILESKNKLFFNKKVKTFSFFH